MKLLGATVRAAISSVEPETALARLLAASISAAAAFLTRLAFLATFQARPHSGAEAPLLGDLSAYQ